MFLFSDIMDWILQIHVVTKRQFNCLCKWRCQKVWDIAELETTFEKVCSKMW